MADIFDINHQKIPIDSDQINCNIKKLSAEYKEITARSTSNISSWIKTNVKN